LEQYEKPLVDKQNFKHLLSAGARTSTTSHMIIELTEPGRNYKAGENIEGVIKVLIDGYFDAASISLRLYGVDKASFLPMSESGKV